MNERISKSIETSREDENDVFLHDKVTDAKVVTL